jgi:hypothetical protein
MRRRAVRTVVALLLIVGCSGDDIFVPGGEVSSPDGGLIATFYGLAGGGAAGWASEFVTLRQARTPFDQSQTRALWMGRTYEVCIHWDSNDQLTILIPAGAIIHEQNSPLTVGRPIVVSVVELPGRRGQLREACPGTKIALQKPNGGNAQPASVASREEHLEAWAGRDPSQGVPPFFDEPELRGPLSSLDPADLRRLKSTYSIGTVEWADGYLVADMCKPHWCPDENAVAALRLRDAEVIVFFYKRPEDAPHPVGDAVAASAMMTSATRCFSTGIQPAALPVGVKQLALESHIPPSSQPLIAENSWFDRLSCKPLPRPRQ